MTTKPSQVYLISVVSKGAKTSFSNVRFNLIWITNNEFTKAI